MNAVQCLLRLRVNSCVQDWPRSQFSMLFGGKYLGKHLKSNVGIWDSFQYRTKIPSRPDGVNTRGSERKPHIVPAFLNLVGFSQFNCCSKFSSRSQTLFFLLGLKYSKLIRLTQPVDSKARSLCYSAVLWL